MPTCPACGVSVGYEELGAHLGTCKFVWSEAPRRTDRLTERLAGKVRRLEQRLQTRGTSAEPPGTADAERERRDDSDSERQRLG